MFPDDFPLLNPPSLLTIILHAAREGPVTLTDCADRVAAVLEEAREPLPIPPEALRERLAGHLATLEAAQLLEPVEEGRWRLTGRGSEALARHPDGIDAGDLMDYPDFAADVRRGPPGASHDDPREPSFEQGYVAGGEGRPFTENPHRPNSVDHQAWENGWMQAMDDGKRFSKN